jgi:hypothetical protein
MSLRLIWKNNLIEFLVKYCEDRCQKIIKFKFLNIYSERIEKIVKSKLLDKFSII